MKSITKLKDEARKHEQKEEWEKAIKAYLQVLDAGDDDSGEVELPLFNRVGDLYVRLARPKDAVHYYEQAADRYAEAGLYNNAIALCNKALRYMPGQMELLRKLGQFSAQQGFFTDARRYYLEYAEKKIAGGEIDAALRALSTFADLAEDAEVRELLGRKLHVHGRTSDAVHELKRAYEMRLEAGESAPAQALRAEILAIDAAAFRGEPEPAATAPTAADGPKSPPAPPAPTSSLADAATTEQAEPEDAYDFRLPEQDSGFGGDYVEPPEPGPLEGLESAVFEGFADASGSELLAGLEPASEFEAPADTGTFEVSGLDRPDTEVPQDVTHLETTGFEESTGSWDGEDVAFDLPTLDGSYEPEEPDTGFDLPLLADDGEQAEASEAPEPVSLFEPLPTLEDAASELADIQGELARAEAELDSAEAALGGEYAEELPGSAGELPGLADDLPPLDEQLPEPGDERPAPDRDLAALPELPAAEDPGMRDPARPRADGSIQDDTDRAELEAAARPGEHPAIADPLEHEEPWDPTQLGSPTAPAPAADAAPAGRRPMPPASDYIDLGSLLTEDDEKAADTRFVVQEKPPTGDEDQDFAELLSQFKQKVAEHVSAEDAAAHYDLGLAFKEMGLVDEAIGEFQIALRAGDMRLKVYEELGQCFLLKEQYNIAEKVLRRALESRYQDELELLGVYYHLGRAYEAMDKRVEARDAYERVLGLDINFGDVSARLARL